MITLGEGLHEGVPMDVYHGNCTAGPSVSGSVLFTLHESCPAKALASHYLSPWDGDDEETEAMALGSAAHTLILEGDAAFADRYAIKPADMNFATKEGKAWKADNGDRVIIRAADFDRLRAMRAAINDHPAARNAFAEGRPEVTAIWKDPETGLYLKTRPDWLRNGLSINYKTAVDASEEHWTRQAIKLGYHVSAALGFDVLKALDHQAHAAFLTQEKTVPFLVSIRVFDDALMEAGRMIYRRAARKFADCIAAGKFDGYGDGVTTVTLPPWLDRKLANLESPL